ncbi:MAG: UDP-N-acetylmuramoyl-tripeptide--D-alanyl-D-alanine ligase [Candidatus Zapsychrus exili]|nr:UDP-N-acetylmuramoyl-tripeptide--D-alanyl-D-alanine ligase [Candidatus Zapsychrus exili]
MRERLLENILMLTAAEIIKTIKPISSKLDKPLNIKGVSIDSRKIKKGDLFIAIKGKNYDGHNFVGSALRKGASCCIVSQKACFKKCLKAILVKDTTIALGQIARFYRSKFNIPVIAVTGSTGKTTTKEMIASVLSLKCKVLKNKKSENNQFGLPLTLLAANKSHQVIVLEVGTNSPGDISYLSRIAKPDVCIFTNIGESHLEKLKTTTGVFNEKFKLIKNAKKNGIVILNSDDKYLSKICDKEITQNIISYGINNDADYKAHNIQIKDNRKLSFNVSSKSFSLNELAQHNIYNALAAICCGRLFNISYNNININSKALKLCAGRQKIVKKSGLCIIDDTYNSNPVSLKSAVDTLSSFKTRGKKIFVCADMLELGKRSAALHELAGKQISKSDIDILITTGKHSKQINKALKMQSRIIIYHEATVSGIKKILKKECSKGDVILVKGSRAMKMERIVEFLMKVK